MTAANDNKPWTTAEFEQQVQAMGESYYIYHPYHVAMKTGKCTREQIQG